MSTSTHLTFYLNGQSLGQSRLIDRVVDVNVPTYNLTFFCPSCGRLWAHITVSDRPDSWHVRERYCDRHLSTMWPQAWAGHLYTHLDNLDFFPRSVLRREFELTARLREELLK